ncbi:ShlB/FhaC/HecB family hemolysin secretion/activation protein, partial [Proteus mirabilis]|uniref:ShlB/FhaC/HecB family hemolysin secretion/activation protein n=1 Tax=Proteus mirabilis TaxID=584 RepID=UPI0025760151
MSLSKVGKRTMAGSLSIDNKEQKIYGDLFVTTRLSFGNLAQLNDNFMVILSSQLDTLKSSGIKKQIFL